MDMDKEKGYGYGNWIWVKKLENGERIWKLDMGED